MAAPHVSATAALIIASGVLGSSPTPKQIEERLESTARDLGPAGYDRRYGFGLIDAAKATDPTVGPVIAPPETQR
jgi:serine protease